MPAKRQYSLNEIKAGEDVSTHDSISSKKICKILRQNKDFLRQTTAEIMHFQQTCARRNFKGSYLGRRNMKEMKEEFVTTQHHKNTQDHKKLLQTIMHQQVQQIRRHELIPKNIQTIKTEP